MSRESMSSSYHRKEVTRLCERIISNRAFITNKDMKVLEFLANKGDYNSGDEPNTHIECKLLEFVKHDKQNGFEKTAQILFRKFK